MIRVMSTSSEAHPSGGVLDGLRRGDGHAVAQLRAMVLRHLHFALRPRGVSEADLEDFVQEAMIRVLDGLDGYRADASFSTWVAVVAVRSALTLLRRRTGRVTQRLTDTGLSDVLAKDCRPAEVVLTDELRASLVAAIDHELTGRQREVIVAELQGVPQVCIAERLGVSANAVYKLSHDARKKLRAVLAQCGLIAEKASARPVSQSRRQQ